MKDLRPWTSGPRELLDHGLEHLSQGKSDFDRRIALISIDNAVELMIKTFLSQPKRSHGIHIPRKELEEVSLSFPALLDALEKYAADRVGELDLSDIEWFHRLRNELYHSGNGLTVEVQKVQVYAALARQLFINLFEVAPADQVQPDLVSNFLATFEQIRSIGEAKAVESGITHGMGYQLSYLYLRRHFPEYEDLKNFRNDLVHSTTTKSTIQVTEKLAQLKSLLGRLERLPKNPGD